MSRQPSLPDLHLHWSWTILINIIIIIEYLGAQTFVLDTCGKSRSDCHSHWLRSFLYTKLDTGALGVLAGIGIIGDYPYINQIEVLHPVPLSGAKCHCVIRMYVVLVPMYIRTYVCEIAK